MRQAWKIQELRDCQALVRTELDAINPDIYARQRLEYCVQQLNQFNVEMSSSQHLRVYVYTIQALLHHSRSGGLRSNEVKRIYELAHKLLKLYRIRKGGNKLDVFHADLSNVMSFVEFANNRSWLSIWDMNISHRLREREEFSISQELGLATRLFKLGYLCEAETLYQHCQQTGSPHEQRRATIGLIKCARWKDNLSEAARYVESIELGAGDGDAIDDELLWEQRVTAAAHRSDFVPLASTFATSDRLYQPVYVLESWLWHFATLGERTLKLLPNSRQIQNRRDIRLSTCAELLEVVQCLEQCYDSGLDIEERLTMARRVFELSLDVHSIDSSALALAAILRWLNRLNFHLQQELVARRIHSLVRDISPSRSFWLQLATR